MHGVIAQNLFALMPGLTAALLKMVSILRIGTP